MDEDTATKLAEIRSKYSSRGARYAPMPLDETKALWLRQRRESVQAYAAFMAYLLLPIEDRTYARTCEQIGKSLTLVRQWGMRWQWRNRAAAYAEHHLLMKLESVEENRDRMWREQEFIAGTAIEILKKELEAILMELIGDPETGVPPKKGIIKADALNRLLDTATKIQRQAVLGRTKNAEKVAERHAKLNEQHGDELYDILSRFMNMLQLTPDQQDRGKLALTQLLLDDPDPKVGQV
jgi:hypothetical protein